MLPTGLKKKKKVNKAVTGLIEDRQAFGVLLSKGVDLNYAFQYPITSLPLSIATPDGNLRDGSKSVLRNYIIDNAN